MARLRRLRQSRVPGRAQGRPKLAEVNGARLTAPADWKFEHAQSSRVIISAPKDDLGCASGPKQIDELVNPGRRSPGSGDGMEHLHPRNYGKGTGPGWVRGSIPLRRVGRRPMGGHL